MAFADPQSLPIFGVTETLPRVSTGVNNSTYQAASGAVKMTVAHQYGKRTRRTIRIQHTKTTPDPLIETHNIRVSASVYVVVDIPAGGAYTNAEVKDLCVALSSYLTASTNANSLKLAGGEN